MKKNSIRKAAQRAVPVLERCEICGATDVPLQRHHADYSKPKEITVVCSACHAKIHARGKASVRCVVCGREFTPKDHPGRAKICSAACYTEYRKRQRVGVLA